MEQTSVEVNGPFRLSQTSRWMAWVTKGRYFDQDWTVCMVCEVDSPGTGRLQSNLGTLFEAIVVTFAEQTHNWRESRYLAAVFQPAETGTEIEHDNSGYEFRVDAYRGSETTPARIANDMLSAMSFTYTKDVNGKSYTITEHDMESDEGWKKWEISVGDNDFVSVTMGPELTDEILRSIQVFDQVQAAMYLSEATKFCNSAPKAAFRSYNYFLSIGNELEKGNESALVTGIEVARSLLTHRMFDYAAFLGGRVADVAEKATRFEQAATAQRIAVMASHNLGRVAQTIAECEKSIRILGHVSDEVLKAQVQMDYGISVVSLFSHWETQRAHSIAEKAALERMLVAAEMHLRTARNLYDSAPAVQRRVSHCAIDLDIIRIDDLRTNEAGSSSALQRLSRNQDVNKDSKLIATLWAYQCAMYKKLADKDPSKRRAYLTTLRKAHLRLKKLTEAWYWLWLIDIFASEELVREDRADEAVPILVNAYAKQYSYCGNEIRPATPGSPYGGFPAVDVCGKLQNAILQRRVVQGEPDRRWDAFALADHAKGRFFKRDLAAPPNGFTLPLKISERGAEFRSMLLAGGIDYRVVMADYEWHLEQEAGLGKDALEELYRDELLTPTKVGSILDNSGTKTILLSFYETSESTVLYVIAGGSAVPVAIKIDITPAEVLKVSAGIHTGISGDRYYAAIDAKAPEKHERFFAPFLEMAEDLRPLIDMLTGCERILISPHGAWHGLPLHVLFLPALWALGDQPGITYIPSLQLFQQLQRREILQPRGGTAALTTAPASGDPQQVFQGAHDDLSRVFTEASLGTSAAFGVQATPVRLLDDIQTCGVHHILAHGSYGCDQNPMQSGILLSDGSVLPHKELMLGGGAGRGTVLTAATLMGNGTRAQHVTMQSCSLGRILPGRGDEFWGVTRALIAGGANSVLAPSWDIDLESSTRMLVLFYENWLVKGMPKWKALATAQHRLASGLEQKGWQHFYHWAPFQLVGM